MRVQLPVLKWFTSNAASATRADWEALYRETLPRIYNFFRYRVGDGSVAEDLTADTFEKAWRARQQYRSDVAAFSTWLFSIARNVATDYFRKRQLQESVQNVSQRPGENTPEQSAIRHSDFRRLSTLLSRLSHREQELLALKYGSELNNRVISRITGLSESNIGTSLHRTLCKLRAQWQAKD